MRPGADGRARRLLRAPWTRFALLFLLTALVLGAALVTSDVPPPLPLLAAAALLGPTLAITNVARLGLGRLELDLGYEAGLLVALSFAREPWLVLLVAGVLLLRELLQRRPVLKAATNIGVFVVPLGGALGLLSLAPPAPGPEGWPLLAVAVLLAAVLNELLLDVVLAGVTGTRVGELLLRDLRGAATRLLLNITAGLSVLAVLQAGSWELLVALPVLALIVVRAQGRRLKQEDLSDALPRIARAARGLDAEDDGALVREILVRTADMFGLRRVELVLISWPGEGDRTAVLHPDGEVLVAPGRAGGGPHVLSRQLLAGSNPPVLLGELRLHFPTAQSLTGPEEQVLSTLVLTSSSALARARSHREQALAARHDHLTGLGNRLMLQEELDARLPLLLDAQQEAPGSAGAALLLVDLDHFKEVNDTLGHSAGDRMLVELSARLLRAVRPDDVVVRLGGDEFALVLVDVRDREQARELAEAVLHRLAAPVVVGGGLELPVEASVGVALAPYDGTSGDDLLRRADVAMYRAKDERNAVVVYDPAMDSGRDQQLSLLGQLHTAIREQQIVVHYQPVVSLSSGSVVAAEALVRWAHPQQGLLPPGAFVPAAERTELIVPLTLEVLEQGVQEAVDWRNDHGAPVTLAVNLSPRCLLDRSLPEQVGRVLARHGLPGRRLLLEITETLALSELEVVEEVLASLRGMGVRISLDDFGTGFSSMSALRRLPVHEVKLDRGFVADMLRDQSARAVVDATMVLAHGLGLPVVGEGVETEEQLEQLRAAGCDLAQGYLLGRPVPAPAFAERLREPARR